MAAKVSVPKTKVILCGGAASLYTFGELKIGTYFIWKPTHALCIKTDAEMALKVEYGEFTAFGLYEPVVPVEEATITYRLMS